jgi:hypothetical protein
LLDRYDIYVQPINYPTVPVGTERLRITPSPLHSERDIDHLISALDAIWTEFGLDRRASTGGDAGIPAIDAGVLSQRAPSSGRYVKPVAHFVAPVEEESSWLTRLLLRLRPEGRGRAYS